MRVEAPLTYEEVIKAIVRTRYSADEVEAILLNAQIAQDAAGDKYDEYRRELAELQEWRNEAKQIAERVVAAAGNNE